MIQRSLDRLLEYPVTSVVVDETSLEPKEETKDQLAVGLPSVRPPPPPLPTPNPAFIHPNPLTHHKMTRKSSSEKETRRQPVDRVAQSRMSHSDQPFTPKRKTSISISVPTSTPHRSRYVIGLTSSSTHQPHHSDISNSNTRKMTGLLLRRNDQLFSLFPPAPPFLFSKAEQSDSLPPRRNTRNTRHRRLSRPYSRF